MKKIKGARNEEKIFERKRAFVKKDFSELREERSDIMSDKNFCFMRFQKIKMQGLAKAERHHRNRSELKHREHPEKEKMNAIWSRENKTLNQLCRAIKKEQESRTGKKLRKDANICIEFVFTFSQWKNSDAEFKEKSEFMKKFENDAEIRKKWIDANKAFLKRMFGSKNVLKFCIEYDEETPHIHAFVCPKDEKENVNFKSYVSNKHDIERMQDLYFEFMKSFGLERGIRKEVSKAFHQPLGRYYAEQRKNAELESDDIIRNAQNKANNIIKAARETATAILNDTKETADNMISDAIHRSKGIGDFVLSDDEQEIDDFDLSL